MGSMGSLTYRLMQRTSESDLGALQQVLLATPAYSLLIEGKLPSPDAALNLVSELPPGKTLEDKFVLGFFMGTELAGCADVIRGYPTSDVAFLGLLLFAEPFQGKRLGAAALVHVESFSRTLECEVLRIAVIAHNKRARKFWEREGFVELYRKPSSQYAGEAIVMQRALALPIGRPS